MAKNLPTSLRKTMHRDFDLSFRQHPKTGKLLIKKDDEAVKQAVKNLVMTNKYERVFNPEFGGDVRSKLFDLSTDSLQYDLEDLINTTIKNFEPRVHLYDDDGVDTVTVLSYPDSNSLAIRVKFKIISSLNNVSLDINVNRVR
jgi:phage baseplate assembly protein W